jgi:hypothetical protein
MSNLELWNKVKRPPLTALKQIGAGRLKGMTDINPQWRIEAITEHFGQCGIGWHYEIVRLWTEEGAQGELMGFAHINLYTHKDGKQSLPIVGVGGSALVAKETAGLRANDEGYKMAITDALSVAMKQLGFGSDIYMGRFDGSKYKDEAPAPKPAPQFTASRLAMIEQAVTSAIDAYNAGDIATAHDCLYGDELLHDNEERLEAWGRLKDMPPLRAAIKKYRTENHPITKETT